MSSPSASRNYWVPVPNLTNLLTNNSGINNVMANRDLFRTPEPPSERTRVPVRGFLEGGGMDSVSTLAIFDEVSSTIFSPDPEDLIERLENGRVACRGGRAHEEENLQNAREYRCARNKITRFFGGRDQYSPSYGSKGIKGVLPKARQQDFDKAWRQYRKAEVLRENDMLNLETRKRTLEYLASPTKSYHADSERESVDAETDSSEDEYIRGPRETAEERLKVSYPSLATSLAETIRFCVLKSRVTLEIRNNVTAVQAVLQPNGRRRIDLWVKAQAASRLKQAMYMTSQDRREGTSVDWKYPVNQLKHVWKPCAQTRYWRLDVYRPWRERPKPIPEKLISNRTSPDGILTFNVNGIWNKKMELCNFLIEKKVGIAAIQETLVDQYKYQLTVPGYEVFHRRKTSKFRGQALLIHRSYTAYPVGDNTDESFIHVRVMGLAVGAPLHIFSVYLPSGGNHRKDKTNCVNKILGEYKKVMDKDPKAKVLILGDFNMKRYDLFRRLKEQKTGLRCAPIRGAGLRLHRKSTKWSDIDSIVGQHSLQGKETPNEGSQKSDRAVP